jgi:hypothetical protein
LGKSRPKPPVILTRAEINRRWRDRHPGAAYAAARSWLKRNPTKKAEYMEKYREKERAGYVRRRYGISLDEYETKIAEPCSICRRTLERSTRGRGKTNMHLDHCHKTGTIRGVLCRYCNTALGLFGDDPGRLRRAADYLEENGTNED